MKRIYLLILFILFSFIGYSQTPDGSIILDHYIGKIGYYRPAGTTISVKDSAAIYMLRVSVTPSDSLQNVSNYKIAGYGIGQDSFFVSYCSGCAMTTGWKLNGDTLKIDTSYVNKIIKDSLNAHMDLITDLDTGKVSTSGDNMYGDLIINSDLEVNGGVLVSTIPLGTDIDSVLVMENGQLKSVDGSSFKPDSTSAGCFNNFYYKQITGCNNDNLYIKADTTKFSNYIKLPKFANNTTEPVLKVLASGRIDTNQTRSIMGVYLDSMDIGEIDASTINTNIANIATENTTYSNVTIATNQSLLLPNLGSNYKPVLSVANLGGIIDTTQVKSITGVDLDSIKITNYVVIGGVVSFDYEFTLADDGIYSFANSSYGFGNLYCFNVGKKTAFTQYSFDVDGVIALETSTPLVVNAELDGNEICLYYSSGTYYIKNTSGGTRTYILSIKYY